MFGYNRVRKTGIRPLWWGTGALALALLATPAVAIDFLEAVNDLPLAPGLVEDREAVMVFDKSTGRIVETRATGRHSSSAVAAFYGETLPQLGWTLQPAMRTKQTEGTIQLRFFRAREHLSLVITDTDGGVVVRFAITPR